MRSRLVLAIHASQMADVASPESTYTGIRYSQHHVLTGRDAVVADVSIVKKSISRFNRQFASSIHGIPRIDGQVEQRIFDLSGINKGIPKAARDDGFDFHAFADGAS